MEKIKNFFSHLFIPHEKNNFKAKALHIDFLSVYLMLSFFLVIFFKQTGFTNVLGFATDITIEKLLEVTNSVRSQNNLPTLTLNNQLSEAARKKASDMFSKNYWAHYSPDGKTPWDFIMDSQYQYEFAGENLAKNFLFSQGVVDAWMASPTHKDNLLKKEYTEVGFAVVNGTLNNEPTTLVVQMFGKPINQLAQKTEVQPENIFKPQSVQAEEKINQVEEIVVNKDKPVTNVPYNINMIFLGFLVIILIVDFYFASKFNIIRIGGKNLIHLLFIGFVIFGIIIISKGTII